MVAYPPDDGTPSATGLFPPSLDEGMARIMADAFARAGKPCTSLDAAVVAAPTGQGKTRAAIIAAIDEMRKEKAECCQLVLPVPTNDLAAEALGRAEALADEFCKEGFRPSVAVWYSVSAEHLDAGAGERRKICRREDAKDRLAELYEECEPAHSLCYEVEGGKLTRVCPFAAECPIARQFGIQGKKEGEKREPPPKPDILICTHHSGAAGKANPMLRARHVCCIDESPAGTLGNARKYSIRLAVIEKGAPEFGRMLRAAHESRLGPAPGRRYRARLNTRHLARPDAEGPRCGLDDAHRALWIGQVDGFKAACFAEFGRRANPNNEEPLDRDFDGMSNRHVLNTALMCEMILDWTKSLAIISPRLEIEIDDSGELWLEYAGPGHIAKEWSMRDDENYAPFIIMSATPGPLDLNKMVLAKDGADVEISTALSIPPPKPDTRHAVHLQIIGAPIGQEFIIDRMPEAAPIIRFAMESAARWFGVDPTGAIHITRKDARPAYALSMALPESDVRTLGATMGQNFAERAPMLCCYGESRVSPYDILSGWERLRGRALNDPIAAYLEKAHLPMTPADEIAAEAQIAANRAYVGYAKDGLAPGTAAKATRLRAYGDSPDHLALLEYGGFLNDQQTHQHMDGRARLLRRDADSRCVVLSFSDQDLPTMTHWARWTDLVLAYEIDRRGIWFENNTWRARWLCDLIGMREVAPWHDARVIKRAETLMGKEFRRIWKPFRMPPEGWLKMQVQVDARAVGFDKKKKLAAWVRPDLVGRVGEVVEGRLVGAKVLG